MVCTIYKWKISQALDTGKSMSPAVSRHIDRCDSCRAFAGLSNNITRRLTQERTTFLNQDKGQLTDRIINSLDNQAKVVQMPARRMTKRLPAMAAALAVIALTLGIVFQFTPTSPPPTQFSLSNISSQVASKSPLQNILSKVESPMEREMRGLGKTLRSAADYLVSQLDFKIGKS